MFDHPARHDSNGDHGKWHRNNSGLEKPSNEPDELLVTLVGDTETPGQHYRERASAIEMLRY